MRKFCVAWALASAGASWWTGAAHGIEAIRFENATAEVGLGGLNAARVCLADLNGDGRADAVIDRRRVFLNRADAAAPLGFRFVEAPVTLPEMRPGDCCVFADLDNDGKADAIVARYVEPHKVEGEPARTSWLRGRGDGTFEEPVAIEAAKPATTAAIAVGDADRDGRLDLWLGNWYERYGESHAGFDNDLLLQRGPVESPVFERRPLPSDGLAFEEERDPGGRPTYGVLIASVLPDEQRPQLVELNYGRRWNRLLLPDGQDAAPEVGLDGDGVRHGRYPGWLAELAKRDPRFVREDEPPFRANGNTFDAAVGDVNNDGRFDLFVSEIAHAWAGDSSDRSRFLIASGSDEAGPFRFVTPPELSVDRIPPEPAEPPEGWMPRWNQGDLFCELADLDHDGRLDLLLSSGDYPDPAPFDQRLRVYRQRADGTFEDATAESGVDHVNSQQISLGDVDGDGDLDVLVGQSFNRFTPEMIAAQPEGEPRVRLFLNRASDRGAGAVVLRLVGDPARGVGRDALGAVVTITAEIGGRCEEQRRQLVGIGGHAGKQHEFLVHAGIGDARACDVEIRWPGAGAIVTRLRGLAPGTHVVKLGGRPAAPGAE